MAESKLTVFRLPGLVPYAEAWELQKRLWSLRVNGEAGNSLIVLQHPPTLTVGKSGKTQSLLVSREELESKGIPLFFTERGGDMTYHGPGQVVAYPILDLAGWGKDIHRYVDSLEEVVIRTLAGFSIPANRDDKYVGAWVGQDKIAAIGVAVRRWVTMHGVALNVNPDLEHFLLIHPCGIIERGVTSMSRLLSRAVAVGEVAERMINHFGEVFQAEIESGDLDLAGVRS